MDENPLAAWLAGRQPDEQPTRTGHAGSPPPAAPEGSGRGQPMDEPGSDREQSQAGPDGREESQAEPPDAAEDREVRSTRTGSRMRRLVIAAAVPWVVAAGFAAAAVTTRAQTPTGAQPSAGAAPSPSAESETGGAVGVAGSPRQAVEAVAVAVARREASGAGQGKQQTYADLAVAESLERHGDVAVVRVLADVLERRDGRWTRAGLQRLAVPVSYSSSPVPLGEPWPLGRPELSVRPLEWHGRDDAELTEEVRRALSAAGYGSIRHTSVVEPETPAPVLRASFEGDPPGRAGPGAYQVWLSNQRPRRVLGAAGGPNRGSTPQRGPRAPDTATPDPTRSE